MTRIRVTPQVLEALGAVDRTAQLTATPTFSHLVEGDRVTYPRTLVWRVGVGGEEVELPAPGSAWAWRLTLTFSGTRIGRVVTFAGASADWADLTDIDPDTLGPTVPPDQQAAWRLALDALAARVDAITSGGNAGGQVFTQASASAQWSIPHGLGRRPAVALYAPDGALMLADVLADVALVLVTFAVPRLGFAVLT